MDVRDDLLVVLVVAVIDGARFTRCDVVVVVVVGVIDEGDAPLPRLDDSNTSDWVLIIIELLLLLLLLSVVSDD